MIVLPAFLEPISQPRLFLKYHCANRPFRPTIVQVHAMVRSFIFCLLLVISVMSVSGSDIMNEGEVLWCVQTRCEFDRWIICVNVSVCLCSASEWNQNSLRTISLQSLFFPIISSLYVHKVHSYIHVFGLNLPLEEVVYNTLPVAAPVLPLVSSADYPRRSTINASIALHACHGLNLYHQCSLKMPGKFQYCL